MRRMLGIGLVAALAFGFALPAAADGKPSPVTNPFDRTVVINHWKFTPNPLTVNVGTTVTWSNLAHGSHTSIGDADEWNSGPIPPGGTFSVTFDMPGTYPYHCRFGHGIHGTITVVGSSP
jgi:plastocyanin